MLIGTNRSPDCVSCNYCPAARYVQCSRHRIAPESCHDHRNTLSGRSSGKERVLSGSSTLTGKRTPAITLSPIHRYEGLHASSLPRERFTKCAAFNERVQIFTGFASSTPQLFTKMCPVPRALVSSSRHPSHHQKDRIAPGCHARACAQRVRQCNSRKRASGVVRETPVSTEPTVPAECTVLPVPTPHQQGSPG